MKKPSPFQILKKCGIWEKNNDPIWMVSSFLMQRNLSFSQFPPKISEKDSTRILTALKQSLLNSSTLNAPLFFASSALKTAEKECILEHFLAPNEPQNPECKSGVVIDTKGDFLAIINGKDHLTLHLLEPHSAWKKGWKSLVKIEAELAEKHPFAYSSTFGYLTSNLSSSGTALNVQAFLHLPCLIQLAQIDDVLASELDEEIQASGLSGTDEYVGDLIIIQNRFTLGLTEDHILEGVHKTATKIVGHEKALRIQIAENPNALIVDKVSRAIGLLKHSFQIETKEALDALSFIKLGVDLKWIEGLTDQELNKIFFKIRRGHLFLSLNEEILQEKLAQKRAEFLQWALKPMSMKL